TAYDDDIHEGSHFSKIIHKATSEDPNFNGAITTLTTYIEDNDDEVENYKSILTQVAAGEGNITLSHNAAKGSDVTIDLFPDPGFEVAKLIDNGQDVTDLIVDHQYVITDVQINHTIIVEYKEKDMTPPTGYTVAMDQEAVIQDNKEALSFTFAGA